MSTGRFLRVSFCRRCHLGRIINGIVVLRMNCSAKLPGVRGVMFSLYHTVIVGIYKLYT